MLPSLAAYSLHRWAAARWDVRVGQLAASWPRPARQDLLEPAGVFEHTLEALLAGVALMAEQAR